MKLNLQTLQLLIILLALLSTVVLGVSAVEYVARGTVDVTISNAVRIVLGAFVTLVGLERGVNFFGGGGNGGSSGSGSAPPGGGTSA